MMDLEKDKEAFFKYTLRWATTIELLLENHLSELLALGKYVGTPEFDKVWAEMLFCQECVVSHLKELMGYASECVTGVCPVSPAWRELQDVSSRMLDFFEPLTKKEDYTKVVFDKAEKFVDKLRAIRKDLTNQGGEVISSEGHRIPGI